MRLKSAAVALSGLSLAVVLSAAVANGGEAAPKLAVQRTPKGKEILEAALTRMKCTGVFNHPDYPWVVRARRVRGDTLYFVDFLRRRKDGKGFDIVGKAVAVSLAFSKEYRPIFEEDGAPVRRDTLRIHVYQMERYSDDGAELFCVDRIIDLQFPSGLREDGFRPYTEAEALLSAKQRQILNKDYPLSREQKKLLAAFGKGRVDLLEPELEMSKSGVTVSESGRTVSVWNEPYLVKSDGFCTIERIAVARFDEKGKVVRRFEGKDISMERKSFIQLINGDESQTIRLRGPDGVSFVLPGIKTDR